MSSRKSGFYYGYIVVIASTFIMVGALGIHYAFGVFFKSLLADFGWSRAVTSGAASLSWIVQGLFFCVMGWLNDKRGSRVVLSLCGVILGSGYLLMSQVHSLWQFYLIYGVIVGAGLGGIFVPLTSNIARWFSVRRSAMTGIVVAGIGIGTLIAPVVADRLIDSYDWRTSYQILGISVLLIIVIAAQFLKQKPDTSQTPYNETPVLDSDGREVLLADAIHLRQFWMIFGLFFCFGLGLYAVLVHLVPFATDLNVTSTIAAGLLSTIGGVSIAGKLVFGRIGDRLGSRSIYIICFILMTLSFSLLTFNGGIAVLYAFAVVFGLAYGGCATAQSTLVASIFGLKAHGTIFGTVSNGFTIGCALGPIMAGYLFDITSSYRLAFIVLTAVAFAGLLFTLALKPIRDNYKYAD